jgi:hypothetical protein
MSTHTSPLRLPNILNAITVEGIDSPENRRRENARVADCALRELGSTDSRFAREAGLIVRATDLFNAFLSRAVPAGDAPRELRAAVRSGDLEAWAEAAFELPPNFPSVLNAFTVPALTGLLTPAANSSHPIRRAMAATLTLLVALGSSGQGAAVANALGLEEPDGEARTQLARNIELAATETRDGMCAQQHRLWIERCAGAMAQLQFNVDLEIREFTIEEGEISLGDRQLHLPREPLRLAQALITHRGGRSTALLKRDGFGHPASTVKCLKKAFEEAGFPATVVHEKPRGYRLL